MLRPPVPSLEGDAVDDTPDHNALPVVHGPKFPDLSHPPVFSHLCDDICRAILRQQFQSCLLQAVQPPIVQSEPGFLCLKHLLAPLIQKRSACVLVPQLAAPADHLDGRERSLQLVGRIVQLGVLLGPPRGLYERDGILDELIISKDVPHFLLRKPDLQRRKLHRGFLAAAARPARGVGLDVLIVAASHRVSTCDDGGAVAHGTGEGTSANVREASEPNA
mmetsp:Transcript_144172/g.461595  ORF Transcript_144172/g.461595 Transcript_144172/m.461595 type:complete len:220 (+) Transcript_144172:708-1367(+)